MPYSFRSTESEGIKSFVEEFDYPYPLFAHLSSLPQLGNHTKCRHTARHTQVSSIKSRIHESNEILSQRNKFGNFPLRSFPTPKWTPVIKKKASTSKSFATYFMCQKRGKNGWVMLALRYGYKTCLYLHMFIEDINFFSFVIYLPFCLFNILFHSSPGY